MLSAKQTAPPAEMPVSLEEAKLHLRVDVSEDDALIAGLIAAATQVLDGRAGVLGRCLVTQEWSASFDGFGGQRALKLPFPDVDPATAVVSYRDMEDAAQTLPSSMYRVLEDVRSAYLRIEDGETWPNTFNRPDAVTVVFQAGYGAASAIPAPIKAAILLTVGHLYQNRQSVIVGTQGTLLPQGAADLVAPYRMTAL